MMRVFVKIDKNPCLGGDDVSETVKDLKARISWDDTGFQQGVTSINRQLKVVQSEFKASSAQAGVFGKGTDNLKLKVDSLTKQFDLQKQKVAIYTKSLSDSKTKQEQAAKAVQDTKTKLDQAKAAYDASAQATGKNSTETKKLKTEVQALEKEYKTKQQTLESTTKSVDNNQIKLNQAKAAMAKTEAELKKTTDELEKQGSKWDQLSQKCEAAGNKLKTAGDKISGVGTTMTKGVTAPILGIAAAALKVGNDFEAQMSRVRAISGATGDDFTALRDKARELGRDTAFSAMEAAQGMENLASAGFSTKEIMAAMPGMLDLAASSGEDLASSADIAASTLRGFKLDAENAGHVADVLAKSAADTNAAVYDTGEAMKYIAPVAAGAEWSFESVTAAIGKMADAGIKGSQAGTTLRGAITRLMRPSKQTADAMASIGFTAYDANGKMKPLSQIIGELSDKTAGLSDEEKDFAIASIFGQEALSGMKVLMDAGKGSLDELTKSLENSDGAAGDMAKTMQDNAKSSIEQMTGSLEDAGIAIQESLAPWITKLANKVGELADKFAKMSPEQQEFIIKTAGIAAVAGPALVGIGKITKGVGDLAAGVGKAAGVIKRSSDSGVIMHAKNSAKVIAGWVKMSIAATANGVKIAAQWTAMKIRAAASATAQVVQGTARVVAGWVVMGTQSLIHAAKVAAAWLIAMGPIALVVAAVVALVAAVILNWNKIKSVVGAGVDWISTKFGKFKTDVAAKFNAVKSAITGPIKSAIDTVKRWLNNLKLPAIRIPHIKMPHFRVSGKWDLVPPGLSVPKIGVSWYDRGGVFRDPAVIGVGEKRPEFVGALDDLRYLIRDELQRNIGDGIGGSVGAKIVRLLEALLAKDDGVYLDGRLLYDGISPHMAAAVSKAARRGRG